MLSNTESKDTINESIPLLKSWSYATWSNHRAMTHKLFGQIDLWHLLTFQEQHRPTDWAQTRTDLKYRPPPSPSIRIQELQKEAGTEHIIGPCSFINASSHTFLLQISRIYLNTHNRAANWIKQGEKPTEKVLRVAHRKRIYQKHKRLQRQGRRVNSSHVTDVVIEVLSVRLCMFSLISVWIYQLHFHTGLEDTFSKQLLCFYVLRYQTSTHSLNGTAKWTSHWEETFISAVWSLRRAKSLKEYYQPSCFLYLSF